jgi:hypothetical protein
MSVVSFGIAIFIFFKFRIVEVIQDLNGTIAKRQIEIMREKNENAKNYGADLLDADIDRTGKTGITGSIGKTADLAQNGTTVLQSNRIINSDFIIIKNVVIINTSECIYK